MKMPIRTIIQIFLLQGLLACTVFADCENRTLSPDCGNTPSAIYDSNGDLLAVFVAGKHVYLSRSTTAGSSFEVAVQVNVEPEDIYTDGENRPVLALGHEGQIYVAWARQNSTAYSGDIRFSRSLDGGKKFAPVLTVNDDGLVTSHRFVALNTTPGGLVYMAWLDKRDRLAALYYTYSDNADSSFAANRKVADNSCECCRIAFAQAPNEQMEVLWRHVFEDGKVRDHAIATLDTYSDVTTAPTPNMARASDDQWYLDGCPHHGPAMAKGLDGFHLSWFTNGTINQGVMYGFHDNTSGLTTRVHSIDPLPAGGGHPVVTVQDSKITVVWMSFNGEQMQLKFVQSPDSGRHWSKPHILATSTGATDHPMALEKGKQSLIAWQTENEGLRLLTIPKLTTGLKL